MTSDSRKAGQQRRVGVQSFERGLALLRENKTLVTSEGTNVTQTFVRVGPGFSATAIGDGDFQSYDEELAPRGMGWEYVESLKMPANAERWASLAVEKLKAKSVAAPLTAAPAPGPAQPSSPATPSAKQTDVDFDDF